MLQVSFAAVSLFAIFAAVAKQTLLVGSTQPLAQKSENDKMFKEYFLNKMNNFSAWILENNLDPSPPIGDSQTAASFVPSKVEVSCELMSQYMKGHSVREKENVGTDSTFESHIITLIRTSNDSLEITARFNCSGKVNSDWYSSELMEDVPFNGEGYLTFTVAQSEEVLEAKNVEITENHNLNFSDSHILYNFYANEYTAMIKANWNDSRLDDEPYSNDIRLEIGEAYMWYLGFQKDAWSPPLHLLRIYLDHIAKGWNFGFARNEELLPGTHTTESTASPNFTAIMTTIASTQENESSTSFGTTVLSTHDYEASTVTVSLTTDGSKQSTASKDSKPTYTTYFLVGLAVIVTRLL